MPAIGDQTLHKSSPAGDGPVKTVIPVNLNSPYDGGEDDPGNSGNVGLGLKNPVGRTTSNRSSVFVKSGHHGKKLGHRRVGDHGEVTYKKFETTQLIGSIQLGLQYAVGSQANIPDRDLLYPATRDRDPDHVDSTPSHHVVVAPASDCESSSTTNKDMFERQGSFVARERMIAHSTPLESITMGVDSAGAQLSASNAASNAASVADIDSDARTSGWDVDNVWGGIPAKNKRGENLLLFIGIIDILQSYRLFKKMEHYWKSLVHDGDTVSVHRPGFYARRFQDFMCEKVFKRASNPGPPPATVESRSSFRRNNFRRTASKEHDGNGPAQPNKEASVTVIKIGDQEKFSDEVPLPPVLQDRPRKTSGTAKHSNGSQLNSSVVVVNADVISTSIVNAPSPSTSQIGFSEERVETGSVITMTSDERVQIFVPSPQGTPYNTITKTESVVPRANLVPLFAPQRVSNSESYRSLTPINMAQSPSHKPNEPAQSTTSLEMIKISLMSNTSSSGSTDLPTTQQTDQTIANDLESLPVDTTQPEVVEEPPVSLSHIHLEDAPQADENL